MKKKFPEECNNYIYSRWQMSAEMVEIQYGCWQVHQRKLMPMKKYIILWVFCLYSLLCIGQLPLVFYIIYRQQGIAIKLNNIFIVENRSESNWKASTPHIIVHKGWVSSQWPRLVLSLMWIKGFKQMWKWEK